MTDHDDATRLAKAITALRRLRTHEFPDELFGEAGWDYLLALFIADAEGKRLTGRAIAECLGLANEPASRWLKHLTASGLVVGDGDGNLDDALTLSPDALERMERMMVEARITLAQVFSSSVARR